MSIKNLFIIRQKSYSNFLIIIHFYSFNFFFRIYELHSIEAMLIAFEESLRSIQPIPEIKYNNMNYVTKADDLWTGAEGSHKNQGYACN